MKCPVCGNENKRGTKFCIQCGYKFEEKSNNKMPIYNQKEKDDFRAANREYDFNNKEYDFEKGEIKEKKGPGIVKTTAIFIVAFLIIGAVGIFGWSSGILSALTGSSNSHYSRKLKKGADSKEEKSKEAEETTLDDWASLENKAEGQYLMEKIASEGCHYEVSSSEDVVFFFEDVAGQIGGQKYIYVKVACPVDVSVTYKGETLSSAENDQNLRTSFGTLSFTGNEGKENNEEESSGYSNTYLKEAYSKVKILRLKEGTDYNIKINGTGDGEMDYTIGFVNDEGEYNDLRRFEDIDINKDTVIDTVANTSKKTLLNIDEDGDGKYDLKLQAGVNGYGEEVKIDRGIYIILAYAFISALIITIIVRRITI